MLQNSAILPTFVKLPFVIKIFVLSIFSGCFTQVLLYLDTFNNISLDMSCELSASRQFT